MNIPAPTRRAFFLLAGGLVSTPGFADVRPGRDQALSAVEIVGQMARLYAGCATYQDAGLVTTDFFHDGGLQHTQWLPFSTALVRPSRFRFEFTARQGGRFLAVTRGEQTWTWWDVQPGVKDDGSLELALAGATGISGGSAHTVPALLMPDLIHGARLTDLVELRRLDNAALADGTDCFRVEGARPADRDPQRLALERQEVLRVTGRDMGTPIRGPETLWIDASTCLLRRIDHQTVHADFRSESTTTYQPLLDGAVSENQLAFDPPAR